MAQSRGNRVHGQLHHVRRIPKYSLEILQPNGAHGALHGAVTRGIKAQIIQKRHGLFHQDGFKIQLQPGISEQILNPKIKIDKILPFQPRHKQNNPRNARVGRVNSQASFLNLWVILLVLKT